MLRLLPLVCCGFKANTHTRTLEVSKLFPVKNMFMKSYLFNHKIGIISRSFLTDDAVLLGTSRGQSELELEL